MKKNNKKSRGQKHMDDKGSINLSDINKTKSKKLGRPVSFKKQKGPKRDEEGKFAATTGSGGLTAGKSFNWGRAFPIIAIITLVGGFFVYQSFAATYRLSRGGPENHDGSKGCTNLPAQYVVPYAERSYLGRSIGEGMVKALFKQVHNRVPTKNELIYWTTTRTNELKNQYGSDCRAISYIGYLEIKALKTFEIDKEYQEDKAAQSSDVVHRIYANEIKRPGTTQTTATQRAGTEGLPVIQVGGTGTIPAYTTYAGRWQSAWPSKYKSCAVIYRAGVTSDVRSGRAKDIVVLNSQEFDLATQKNIATPNRQTVVGEDGRTRIVYNFEKFELCSDYQNAPATRTLGSRTVPATYSFNLQLKDAKKSKTTILLESYSIKK